MASKQQEQHERILQQALDESLETHRQQHNRTLTDADVNAIVEALHTRVTTNFYKDLGKGVWRMFWVAIVGIVVAVAALGHFNITFGGK